MTQSKVERVETSLDMVELTRRRIFQSAVASPLPTCPETKQTKNVLGRFRSFLAVAILVVASIVTLRVTAISANNPLSDGSVSKIPGTLFSIAPNVRVVVSLDHAGDGENDIVSLGEHKATLILDSSCKNPGLWLRLEGEALVGVVLNEDQKSKRWTGSFTLPVEGKYELVSYWYGCDGQGSKERNVLNEIVAKGSAAVNPPSDFPSSSWINSKKFPEAPQQPYVWHNPSVPTEEAKLLKTTDTTVSKQGSVGESGFYMFSELSNYELVCFFGSKSADDLRTAFLSIRPTIFPGQRPFKFHLYPSQNFERPDRDWAEERKKGLRKCKHILVSFEELETSMSQQQYTKQAKTFVEHLLKVMPNDTFPIWMLSLMQSPSEPSNCHSPFLPRSSFHPCNVALKELFQNSPFPDRVRFLDSTDISLPQLGENRKDVLGAVALRIFVIVGKQVQAWREMGQKGTKNGLKRNGTVEPNFAHIPYTGWD